MKEFYGASRSGPRLITSYGHEVHYRGIGEHLTVYNATPPLWLRVNGKMLHVSVGRVEHLADWAHSRIMFFEKKSPTEYHLLPDAPVFGGEDPAVATIDDEIVLSFVRVSAIRKGENLFRTDIYRAKDVMSLWECWRSIPGKDNRFTPLDRGAKIGVMTRPQGGEAKRGQMAYMEFSSLDEVCEDSLSQARRVDLWTSEATWVGPNELHDLRHKNQVGILAHGSFEDDPPFATRKNYFVFFAWMDRSTLTIVDRIPLALREDFPTSLPKISALNNVAFGTGLVIMEEATPVRAELYAGIGDSKQAYVQISDPKILHLYE